MADSLEKLPRASALQSLHRIFFLVFLLAFGATFILIASGFSSPLYYPLLIVLLLATLATTLLSLAQSLPAQNILTVAILIAFLSSVLEMMNLKTHFPFGHRDWTNDLGPRLFHTLPWPLPLIWIIVLLNSRGAARAVLGFLPNFRCFGLWWLALGSIFAAIFAISFEHFAAANHLWLWPDAKVAPWYNFLGYGLVSAVALVLITPWLINKKPGPKLPPDYTSLIVWFLLQLLLAI
jgi:uncharacterized membrane protein